MFILMKLPSQHDAWKRGHKSFSLLNCSALSKIQDKLKIKKKKKTQTGAEFGSPMSTDY